MSENQTYFAKLNNSSRKNSTFDVNFAATSGVIASSGSNSYNIQHESANLEIFDGDDNENGSEDNQAAEYDHEDGEIFNVEPSLYIISTNP